jgi:hypothetical protein
VLGVPPFAEVQAEFGDENLDWTPRQAQAASWRPRRGVP